MPAPKVDLGSGFAITFVGFTGEIVSGRWEGVERAVQDTTHLSTAAPSAGNFGNRTFLFGTMQDPGRLVLTGHFDAEEHPPVQGAAGTLTATWPSTGALVTPATWAASAAVMAFDIDGIGIDEKMMFNATWKLTGEVTVTPSTDV